MNELIEQYIAVKEELFLQLEPTVQVYFCKLWDPMMAFLIMKETKKILNKSLKEKFPDFPSKYFPQIIFETGDENGMELSIQTYFNENTALKYMGSCEMYGHIYDLYYRERYGMGTPMLFARYGHDSISEISGSHEAEAEFLSGQMTPLSMAYQIAIEQGYLESFGEKVI